MADGDFRLAFGWRRHWKRRLLQKRLGAAGVLALEDLWAHAAENCPSGDLSGMSVDAIEASCDWSGEDGLLVSTLSDPGLRLLDGSPGCYRLHDWEVHQPWIVTAPVRKEHATKAARDRWAKKSDTKPTESYPKDTKGTAGGYPEYAPSIPGGMPLPIPSLPVLSDTDLSDKPLEQAPPDSPPVGGHPDSSDSVPEPKPAEGVEAVAPKPAGITFDTNTGMFVGITDTHRAAWSALKPNADVDEELKTAAVVWLGGKHKDANRFLRNFFTPRKPAWKRQKEEAEREWISFLRTVTAWSGYGADEERKDAYLACLSDRVAYAVEALGGTDRRRCAEAVRDSVGYEQERLKRAFLAAFDAFDGGQP